MKAGAPIVGGEIEEKHIPTVLIVDRELGFVFWLGQALDEAGYQALPARSCEAATDLLKQLHVEIDLLIVGDSVPGLRAFSDALRRSQRHLKVIVAVGEREEPRTAFPRSDASQRKCSYRGEISKLDWLETVEAVLTRDCAMN
jgi:hypothetical protein